MKTKSKQKCYGILPMAGKGKRLQPLAFSKELYPIIVNRMQFAISEFSIRALRRAKIDEIKLVVHPDKFDIAKYYANYKIPLSIYFYKSPSLPESCFFPINSLRDDDLCLFGLPDTLFTPNTSYKKIREELEKGADICLGLFKVNDGSKYDSVKLDKKGNVLGVLVKKDPPLSNWVWGIWGATVKTIKILQKEVARQQLRAGERLLGVGFNTVAKKKNINFKALKLGKSYFDIGTVDAIVRVSSIIKNFKF